MTRKAGSLTFPTDALAAMQELSALDAPVPSEIRPTDSETKPAEKISDTDLRTSGSTEARDYASEQLRKHALPEVRTDGSTDDLTEARQPARPQARQGGRKQVVDTAKTDTIMARVEEALASREPLIGGVKATVDMSPELSTRAKRYLADHRGQNSRQVLVALLDAFLAEKGY